MAAPVLVDEEVTVGDFTKEDWFFEAPTVSDIGGFNLQPAVDEAVAIGGTPPAYQPTGNSDYSSRLLVDNEANDANGQAAPALRELLRAYLHSNPRSVGRAQSSQADNQAIAPLVLDGRIDRPASMAGGLLARMANFVLHPIDSDGEVFSILGFDNIILAGGRGGITLSFGDIFSLSLPGANVDISWPGGANGQEAMVTDISVSGLGLAHPDASAEDWASNVRRDGDGGERVPAIAEDATFHAHSGTSPAPRLLLLVYDILTYPGTILMFLAFLLLPLAKTAKNFVASRARRAHRLSRLRRLRKRRIGSGFLVRPRLHFNKRV